jgi:hypothetical protein
MSVSTIKPAGGGDYTVLSLWATAKKFNTGVEDAQCFAGNCGVLTIGDWAPSSSTIYADASAKHNGVDNGTTGLAFSPKISIGGGVAWIIQDFYLTRAIVYQPIMHGIVTLNVRRCMIVNATNTDAVLFKVLVRDDASAPIAAEIWLRNTVLLMKTGSTATTFVQADGFSDSGSSFQNGFIVHVDSNSMYAETSPANGIVWSYNTGGDASEEIGAQFYTADTAIFGATTCFSAPTSTGAGLETLEAFEVQYDASSDGTADDFGLQGTKSIRSRAIGFQVCLLIFD